MAQTTTKLAWSINEFVAAVGISRATIYRRMEDGSIPSRKCGARRLITVSPKDFLKGDAANSS